ncbi:MAG TPA: hypothetical protein VLS96_15985, partial [Nodosilinea sp.]|nr:hypothetical protein [Nodosilinea sp.]
MPLRPYSRSFDDARASSASAGGLERRVTLGLALGLAGLVIALILRLLLPWLLGAAAVGAAVGGWRRYRARQLALHQVFYAQLAAYRGRVSVLDFAIAAQITGGEARRFLDQRAQEFWGDFEPTAAGDVL